MTPGLGMSMGLVAREIRDRAGLAALAPAWWDLWRRASNATPFQSPAWLLPWWDCFAPGGLLVVAVERDGRLVALALFYMETSADRRRILPIGISMSDYHDILVAPEAGGALDLVVERMSVVEPHWDEWELSELAPRAAALALACPRGCEETAEADVSAPVLPLPGDLGELPRILPRGRRSALACARNRAARRGAVEIIDAGAEPSWFLAELVRLHQSRWEGAGEAGVFADARVRSFHAKALPLLCAAGLARLLALKIAGEISAAHYGLLHRDRAYSYLTGFDRAHAFESPGAILLGRAVEQAVCEGAREFHFLRGNEAYKFEWGAVDRRNTRRLFRRRKP